MISYPLDKEMPKAKMQSFFLEAVRQITSPDRSFHSGSGGDSGGAVDSKRGR